MSEEHVTKTQETRWQIWRSQSVAIVVIGVVIALAWFCGWAVGMGL